MAEHVKLTTKKLNNIAIINIEGHVTASHNEAFEETYQTITEQKILLSFREQDQINSSGIAILIDLIAAAKKDNKQVAIAHPRAHFRKVFDLVGLPEFITIFASEEEACKTF